MLNKRYKYLQIAFNRSLAEVRSMIALLPASEKIIIEAGTPFIKRYGQNGVSSLKNWWSAKLGKEGLGIVFVQMPMLIEHLILA